MAGIHATSGRGELAPPVSLCCGIGAKFKTRFTRCEVRNCEVRDMWSECPYLVPNVELTVSISAHVAALLLLLSLLSGPPVSALRWCAAVGSGNMVTSDDQSSSQ